jgi:hypothetical protein
MVRYLKWVACVGLLVSGSVMAFTKPPFPRMSVLAAGGAQNYEDPAIQQRYAKFSFSIWTIFPEWEGAHHYSYQQAVQNVKAINPNSLVFPYLIMMSSYPPGKGALVALSAKLDAQRWWLYSSGTSGSPLADAFPGQWAVNTTLFPAPDSNGDRYVNWYAKWAISSYFNHAPAIDGFWTDGVGTKPVNDGDFNLDGSEDNIYSAASWHRQGYRAYFNSLRAGMPGKYQLGNLADWGRPDTDITDYNGMLNGGLIEGMIGMNWSVETWGGWQAMMAWYRKTMTAVAEPKLVQFHLLGNVGDYQTMRYALTSCLMDDGYFTFDSLASRTESPDSSAPWFDEYNANLGYATSSPPTAEWQSGVYRRDFQNGIALVNPKGNGARQVFLETDYVKLSGSQAPGVNDGQTVRSVILQDRDGIILKRVGAAPGTGGTSTASSSSSSASTVASSSSSSASSASSSGTPVTTTPTTNTAPTSTPATVKVPAAPPAIAVQ